MIKNQALVYLPGLPAIITEDIILMIFEMATVKCSGLMEPIIKVLGKKESKAEKESSIFQVRELERVFFVIMFIMVFRILD